MLCVVNKVATYGFTAMLSKDTLETTPMFVLAIMCERFVGRGLKTTRSLANRLFTIVSVSVLYERL